MRNDVCTIMLNSEYMLLKPPAEMHLQPNAETRSAYMELKGRSMNPLNMDAKLRINHFFHALRTSPQNGLVNLHVRPSS